MQEKAQNLCNIANSVALSESEDKQIEIDAFHIISEYINEEWRKNLSTSLNIDIDLEAKLKEEKSGSKRSATWEADVCERESDKMQHYTMGNVVAVSPEAEVKKKLNSSQSFGLKKLKKVNTKGMKSIGSFFVKKKK